MTATVHYLHSQPEPIGQFLRIGNSGHRQLETLQSAGRLRVERVIVEAAWNDAQKDLIHALREAGVEIVLNPIVAELSAVGRYQGAPRHLPWANPLRPLAPKAEHFLNYHLAAADRTARQAAKLHTGDNAMAKVFQRASLRLDRMRSVLEDLHRTIGNDASRSASLRRRGNAAGAAADEIG